MISRRCAAVLLVMAVLSSCGVAAEPGIAPAPTATLPPPRPTATLIPGPTASENTATAVPAPSGEILVLVDGLESDGTFETFAPFVAALGTRACVFRFSYAGGYWNDVTWMPNSYTKATTEQPLSVSVGRLVSFLTEIRQIFHPARLAIAGYSLGGLLAVQALATMPHGTAPDLVLTFDSPLNGVDMLAKTEAKHRAALAAGTLGIAVSALAGLGAGSIVATGESAALAVELLAPGGPISEDFGSIYTDANWRTQRNAAVASAVRSGARVVTFANQEDCLYYVAICAQDVGKDDSDDRRTMHLSVAGTAARDYRLAARHFFWSIPASHEDILSSISPAISWHWASCRSESD